MSKVSELYAKSKHRSSRINKTAGQILDAWALHISLWCLVWLWPGSALAYLGCFACLVSCIGAVGTVLVWRILSLILEIKLVHLREVLREEYHEQITRVDE